MNKRLGLLCHIVLSLLILLPSAGFAQGVAITFDDLPLNGELPAGVTRVEITKSVLTVLTARRAPTIYGFVNAKKLEGNRDSVDALKLWVAAGEQVGNHTYSHLDLNQNTPEAFEKDLAQNEPVLELLDENGDWRWLRFPYLREGDTLEKRHAVRWYLRDHGYRIAEVTLDYEDYLWNTPYARCLAKHDEQAMKWLASTYLRIASEYIDGDRQMAKLVFGRDINHVLLLHLGAFSAVILPSVLDMLQQKGLHLVTLEAAQADPAYQQDPDAPSSRSGDSLLEQHMNAKKLVYPKLPPKPYKELENICR